jgi:hypothetical protein
VAESIFAWQDFDKRAEVANARYDSVVDLADLDRRRASFHSAQGRFGRIGIGASYSDVSFVIDIDGRTGIFLDCPNVFAARSDEQSNLIWIDLGPEQTWCVSADFISRLGNAGEHLSKDLDPSLASLLEGGANDLFTDAVDLQVQLDTCDTVLRSSDFEIHVTMVIFVTDDVRQ